MPSVLEQMQWTPVGLGNTGSAAEAYLGGQRVALERQRTQIDVAEEQRKQRLRLEEAYRQKELMGKSALLDSVNRLQGVASKSPPQVFNQAYAQERQRLAPTLDQILPGFSQQLPDQMDPGSLQPLAQNIRKSLTAASDPKQWESYQKKAADMLAAAVGDDSLADPQFARQRPEWRGFLEKAIEGQKHQTTVNVSPQINVGPTTATTTKLQGNVIDAETMLAKVQQLKGIIGEDYSQLFGVLPQWNKKIAGLQDKWLGEISSEPLRDQYRRMLDIKDIAGKINAFAVHELSGANYTAMEMKRNAGRILDEDMAPEQFRMALTGLQRDSELSISIANSLMRGFNLETPEGKKAFGAEVDRQFGTAKLDSRHKRIDELRTQKLSDDQIANQLHAEGF